MDSRGRARMVVRFTITYAIGAYHHCCCGFDSRSGRGVHHYVIKFVRGGGGDVSSNPAQTRCARYIIM